MIKSKKGQNLVEVVLIVPLLIVIILGILEYGLFQRNVAATQDIAAEAAIAASKHFVPEDASAGDPFTENAAVEAAVNVVTNRGANLIPENITLEHNDLGPAFGQRPFALYEFRSKQKTKYKGNKVPRVTFTVDYRDPKRDGVSTQLIYHYNLILFGFEFAIPGVNGGRTITIIPGNIQISSTQTSQYVNY